MPGGDFSFAYIASSTLVGVARDMYLDAPISGPTSDDGVYNLQNVSVHYACGKLSMEYDRLLNTGDSQDDVITTTNQRVLFAADLFGPPPAGATTTLTSTNKHQLASSVVINFATASACATALSVRVGATTLAPGGTINLGTTTVGAPVTATVTFSNTQNSAFCLAGHALPAGFAEATAYSTGQLSFGQQTTWVIRMTADTAGVFSGSVTVDTSEASNSPFTFTVTGQVIEPSTTPSASTTESTSLTASTTASISRTPSETPSVTPSNSVTPSITPTRSVTRTPSRTSTTTPSSSSSPTASPSESSTASTSASLSATPSVTSSASSSPSETPTPSVTPSRSLSPSASATISRSESATSTNTASVTPSLSDSASATASATASLSAGLSASSTSSTSLSSSVTSSATSSPSLSSSATSSVSATPSTSATASPSLTPSPSPSVSATLSPVSNTRSLSSSSSPSSSPSPSRTHTPSASTSESSSQTTSTSLSSSATATVTPTLSETSSASRSPSHTASPSRTPSRTATNSETASSTGSSTRTRSMTPSSSTVAAPSASPGSLSWCSSGNTFCLSWSIDASDVTFTMQATARSWLGFGFTDIPDLMFTSTVYVGWEFGGQFFVSSRRALSHNMPVPETTQVVQLVSGSLAGGKLTITFKRPLSAAPSLAATSIVNLIWAINTADLPPTDGALGTFLQHTVTGSTRLSLAGDAVSPSPPTPAPPTPPAGSLSWCSTNNVFCMSWFIDRANDKATFTMWADTTGWIAFGVTDTAGRMYNSRVYVGWIETSGSVAVSNRRAVSHNMPVADSVQIVTALNASRVGSTTTVSFSRPISADPPLADSDSNIIWAVSGATSTPPSGGPLADFTQHVSTGSIVLNFFTGASSPATDSIGQMKVAHGFMMAIAWVLLVPMGNIVARFLKAKLGAWWFRIHVTTQTLAVALTIAGVGLALYFTSGTATTDTALVHRIFGFTVFGCCLLQLAIGVAADRMFNPERSKTPAFPDKWHWWLGRSVTVIAAINVFLGIVVYSAAPWALAVAGVLCLLACLTFAWLQCSVGQVHDNKSEGSDAFMDVDMDAGNWNVSGTGVGQSKEPPQVFSDMPSFPGPPLYPSESAPPTPTLRDPAWAQFSPSVTPQPADYNRDGQLVPMY